MDYPENIYDPADFRGPVLEPDQIGQAWEQMPKSIDNKLENSQEATKTC